MALTLMVIIYIQSSRGILRAPKGRGLLREILVAFKDSVIPLMMPVIISGGSSAEFSPPPRRPPWLRSMPSFVSFFIYKEIKLSDLKKDPGGYGGNDRRVCLLVGAATGFSWILATHQVPRRSETSSVHRGRIHGFLLMSVAVFLFFGNDPGRPPGDSDLFPILYPIAQSLGIHPCITAS